MYISVMPNTITTNLKKPVLLHYLGISILVLLTINFTENTSLWTSVDVLSFITQEHTDLIYNKDISIPKI